MSAAVLFSNGANEARAYAELALPAPAAEPPTPAETIALTEPGALPPPRVETKAAGAGPRNPAQTVLPAEGELEVELPEGLPLTEAQVIIVPPELAAQWREEAKRNGTT
jgi:hypothetical protein